MILYKTVAKEAQAEQVIEKSRFIAHVKPVSTKEEADAFIASIRTLHKTASHNVPAMVLGDKFQTQWTSDDGEPSGTSGAPILQMLAKEGTTNTVIVVTQYFGGIKLGTGGLIRAYTGSAKLGIEKAGVCQVQERVILCFKIEYPYLNKIQSLARNGSFQVEDILYEEMVKLKVSTGTENATSLEKIFSDLTAGGAALISKEIKLAETPLT